MKPNTKKCPSCRRTKPFAGFGISRCADSGLQSWCKECARKYQSQRRKENKKKHAQLIIDDDMASPPVVAVTEDPPETLSPSKAERAAAILSVFEYYKWVTGFGGKLGDKERGKIAARLNECWSVEDLKRSIDGMLRSTWHLENNQQTLFIAMRDSSQVEKFIRLKPGRSASLERQRSAIEEFAGK